MKKTISNALKDLGVPASLRGYYYLRYGIELMVKDMTLVSAICTKLYPAIAKEFNVSWQAVERCIRTAIETGWDRGNIETKEKIFGYMRKIPPTNAEFMATVADYILLESEGK